MYAESGFLNQDVHTWLGLCITEPFGRNFEKIHIQINFVFQFCFVSFWIWFVGAFSRFRPNVHWLPELAANRVPTSLHSFMHFGFVCVAFGSVTLGDTAYLTSANRYVIGSWILQLSQFQCFSHFWQIVFRLGRFWECHAGGTRLI